MRDPMRNADGTFRDMSEFAVITLTTEQMQTIHDLQQKSTGAVTIHCEAPYRAILVYTAQGMLAVNKDGETRGVDHQGDFTWAEWQEKNIEHVMSGGKFID
jgi:hypothetical protein